MNPHYPAFLREVSAYGSVGARVMPLSAWAAERNITAAEMAEMCGHGIREGDIVEEGTGKDRRVRAVGL